MHGIILETPNLTRPPVINDVLVMGLESGVAVILSANKTYHYVGHFDGRPQAAEQALEAHIAELDKCSRRGRIDVAAVASADQGTQLFARLTDVIRARQADVAISDWPGPAIGYDYRQCAPRSETPPQSMRMISPKDQFKKCLTKARRIMAGTGTTPGADIKTYDNRTEAAAPSLRSPTPHAHTYETEEVRAMLQVSEGAPSPVTNAPAHARGLHALQTKGGVGTTKAALVDRTHQRTGESNRRARNRVKPETSAFNNIAMQAEAACQVLNSVTGQAALRVLDIPQNTGRHLRVMLKVLAVREAGFLERTQATRINVSTRHSLTVESTPEGAAGVTLILDRAAGQSRLHIQTCYGMRVMPSNSFTVSEIGPGNTSSVIARG